MTMPHSPPCFTMDHMVIRLGKYLRIAGYDAVWDLGVRTHDLIHNANASGRIFVTRNRRIAEQCPVPIRMVTVASSNPAVQFADLARQLELDVRQRVFSMCIRCNTDLVPVPDKTMIRDRVHENVFARHDRFFCCPHCGTVFWHGSHVVNTCRKLNIPQPASA